MDYKGLYRDLIRIGERAFFRMVNGNPAAAWRLMDEAAKFRSDILADSLLAPSDVDDAVKDAAIIFTR